MLCILFNNIVVISSNLVLGFFFGWRAYYQAKKAARKKAAENLRWMLTVIESILVCILDLVVFAKFGVEMQKYILVAGTYLVVGMKTIGNGMFIA